MLSAVEATLQRRVTKQFIDANPTSIILLNKIPGPVVGGTQMAGTDVARAAQTFRLVWLEERGINERPPDGTRKFDFALVGQHDAAVDIGDHWKLGEQEFVIESIAPSNEWEVKAYGVSHGPKPDGN